MEGKSGGDLYLLPEGCLEHVLWFTGPRDAGRLSATSSAFKSASESDAVWERFLPLEYKSIISESSDPSLLACSSSKKELYLRLCDHPILIDNGKKSFWLEKWSGKKCFMLSARDLMIVWGDTPRYWRWTSEDKSRFAKVAELIGVCWLEIRGKISARMLSPETLYTAYLVYKTTVAAYGFEHQPVEVTVGHSGTEGSKRRVYLDVERERRQRYQIMVRRGGIFPSTLSRALGFQEPIPARENDGLSPQERLDGWLEIELGDFFNREGEHEELEISILEVNGGDWKGGLILQGIEIRPKQDKNRNQ